MNVSSNRNASRLLIGVTPYCHARFGEEASRRKLCWVERQNTAGRSVVAFARDRFAAACRGCDAKVRPTQTLVSKR
jgi:hypothetical protein